MLRPRVLPALARPSSWLGALLLGGALLSVSSSAGADDRVFAGTWRRSAEEAERKRKPADTGFAAELRVGAYRPRVDTEFSGTGPYEQVFGDASRVYVGLEVDWQPLRIPFVGTLGPGLGWGYTRSSAKALVTGTSTRSGETTSLTVQPLHLSAVLRLDELQQRKGIPVVPYAKAGLGVGLWSVGGSNGTLSYDGVSAKGSSWGRHLALGTALSLDFLDRSAALAAADSAGVRHSYVFGEWMLADLGRGEQMRVGSSTWVTGLALEF